MVVIVDRKNNCLRIKVNNVWQECQSWTYVFSKIPRDIPKMFVVVM